MAKGPSSGYVYAIVDPEGPPSDHPDCRYIFVGNSNQPWSSIQLHIKDSNNEALKQWGRELIAKHRGQIEILDSIVCDHYHDPSVKIPPLRPGVFRLEWVILDLEEEVVSPIGEGSVMLNPPSKKRAIIKRLVEEGHPLFNGPAGRRPKKSSK
jgi:hypothetical protein